LRQRGSRLEQSGFLLLAQSAEDAHQRALAPGYALGLAVQQIGWVTFEGGGKPQHSNVGQSALSRFEKTDLLVGRADFAGQFILAQALVLS
jgi:hypothetical protein